MNIKRCCPHKKPITHSSFHILLFFPILLITVNCVEDLLNKPGGFEMSNRSETMYFIPDSEKGKKDWINSNGRSTVHHLMSVTDNEIVDYGSSKNNNAGIVGMPFALSADGIEMQFPTNHIGHFLPTNLLLDNIKNTARDSNKERRIVNVSSLGHKFACKGIEFDYISDQSSYSTLHSYGVSKLANILHAKELAKRLKNQVKSRAHIHGCGGGGGESVDCVSVRSHGLTDQKLDLLLPHFFSQFAGHRSTLSAFSSGAKNINEIISKMAEDNPGELGNLNIVYGDESLHRIYENSCISADQLPGQSGINNSEGNSSGHNVIREYHGSH